MKRWELWPEHTGLDKKFDSTWQVAYHFPMTFIAPPMCFSACKGLYEIWDSGDLSRQYGDGFDPALLDPATWFVCYFALDTVLVIVHGLGTMATYVHHLIFGVIIALLLGPCGCQFTVGMMITQE